MMQSRLALACVLGAIFGAVALAAVPREASTAAAPGRRLSGEPASRAATCCDGEANGTAPALDTKYLQYFVTGGWSNQLTCLKNAYEVPMITMTCQ